MSKLSEVTAPPARKTTDADLNDILNDVNFIRTTLLMGEGKLDCLPKGVPGEPEFCVLAAALSNGWSAFVDGSNALVIHEPGPTTEDFRWDEALTRLTDKFGGADLRYMSEDDT